MTSMVFDGQVVGGCGQASKADTAARLDELERLAGVRLIPGTLNVERGEPIDLSGIEPVGIYCTPETPPHLGPASLFRATVQRADGSGRSCSCFVFRHQGTGYKTRLELKADRRIRDFLELEDGDRVTVTVLPAE